MDGFPYEPLEGPRDIRLVHILPGQVDEPILCTIQHVSLDLSPEYNAISYTWGDLSIKHTIICDGTKVEITLNLFDALHQFRRRDNVHVIWADQLCIDQENIAERNMQVGVMGEIYSRCQSCLAFLGKAVGEDFDALDLVEDIAKISPATPLSQGGALRDTETDIDRFSARRDPRWKALYKFFGRPWFSRVWIIQEAVLSPRCALFYGSRESSLSVLGEFLQAILENSNRWNLGTEIGNDEKKAFGRDVNRAMALAGSSSIRKRIGNSKIVSDGLLYSNLALTRYAAATDPRDKIYGILGLVDHLQERVIPDYNMETAEVYNMIARRLVKSGEGLDTLYQAATNTPQSMEGLLSWAPDWSISNDRDTWLDVLLKQHIPHAPKSATVKLLPDLTSISIDCLIFDSIEAMTKISHERAEIGDGLELDFLEHALEDWAAAESLFPDREWYPTGELAATAFWRTLVTNNIDAAATPMGEPKPSAEYVRKALEFAALQNLVQLVRNSDGDRSWLPKYEAEIRGKDALGITVPGFSKLIGVPRAAAEYRQSLNFACGDPRFCTTKKGYFGIVQQGAKPGDIICVFSRAGPPFVLHPRDDGSSFQAIGRCYIHGIMDGEVWQRDAIKVEDIVIR